MRPTINSLGNKIGSFTFHLPMDIDDPVERVIEVSKVTSQAKKIPEPIVSYNLARFFSVLPGPLTRMIFCALSSQVYCAMSNVRGSPFLLTFTGHKMQGLIGVVPPPHGVSIAIGLASYQDWLICTANCDKNTIPDPRCLLKYYKEEFVKLEQKYLNSKQE